MLPQALWALHPRRRAPQRPRDSLHLGGNASLCQAQVEIVESPPGQLGHLHIALKPHHENALIDAPS